MAACILNAFSCECKYEQGHEGIHECVSEVCGGKWMYSTLNGEFEPIEFPHAERKIAVEILQLALQLDPPDGGYFADVINGGTDQETVERVRETCGMGGTVNDCTMALVFSMIPEKDRAWAVDYVKRLQEAGDN